MGKKGGGQDQKKGERKEKIRRMGMRKKKGVKMTRKRKTRGKEKRGCMG